MHLTEEDVADLLADLERVQRERKPHELTWKERIGKRKPLKQKNGNMRRNWTDIGGKGRWAHPLTG